MIDDIIGAYIQNERKTPETKKDTLPLYQKIEDLSITDDGNGLYHIAAQYCDYRAIEYLIQQGLKHKVNERGETAFHALVKSRYASDAKKIEEREDEIRKTALLLLDNLEINPKKRPFDGDRAVTIAIQNAVYPVLEILAEKGVKLDEPMEEGRTALHSLCSKLYHRRNLQGEEKKVFKALKALLDSGLDPDAKDMHGYDAHYYAQSTDSKMIMNLLAGMDEEDKTGGMTIEQAISNRDIEALEILLKEGADPNEVFDNGRTGLMSACFTPNLPAVECLWKYKADPNYRSGETDMTAPAYLLAHGMERLYIGLPSPGQPQKNILVILQKMLDAGLDIDASVNKIGDTMLNLACEFDYMYDKICLPLISLLIDEDCSLNKPNNAGITPLMKYARLGDEQRFGVVELLLENKIDTNYKDAAGNTALIHAAYNSKAHNAKLIAEQILEYGTESINEANNNGETALDVAIASNKEELVKLLLTYQ